MPIMARHMYINTSRVEVSQVSHTNRLGLLQLSRLELGSLPVLMHLSGNKVF